MITLEKLTFTYPGSNQPALRDVTLSLGPGVHAFVGPSGGGKSTFLRLINGLVPHSTGGHITGRVEILGANAFTTPTRILARTASFLFQDVELQSVAQTVERDVAFGLENLRMARDEISRRIDNALELCGISDLRTRTLATLSGGERQLAALAAVVAMDTAVLCLDEPLAQLDVDFRSRAVRLCQNLAMAGKIVLVSEHQEDCVRSLTDSVFSFQSGTLAAGIPERIFPRRSQIRLPGARAWELTNARVAVGGSQLLTGISAVGHRGQVLAVTGHNGSGKTTLLRTLAGLQPLSDGSLQRDAPRCAYLPQNPASLLWRKSIRAEIEFTLRQRGGGSVESVLREFSLTSIASHYPADVSTGERQRAALATVLCGSPDLLLLDEPTRGMDRQAFDDLVRAIDTAAIRGACVVVATHDQDLIDAVADAKLHLSHGAAVIEQGLLGIRQRAMPVTP